MVRQAHIVIAGPIVSLRVLPQKYEAILAPLLYCLRPEIASSSVSQRTHRNDKVGVVTVGEAWQSHPALIARVVMLAMPAGVGGL